MIEQISLIVVLSCMFITPLLFSCTSHGTRSKIRDREERKTNLDNKQKNKRFTKSEISTSFSSPRIPEVTKSESYKSSKSITTNRNQSMTPAKHSIKELLLLKVDKSEQSLSSWREQAFSETPPMVNESNKMNEQNRKDKKENSKFDAKLPIKSRTNFRSPSLETNSAKSGISQDGRINKTIKRKENQQLALSTSLPSTAEECRSQLFVEPSNLAWKSVIEIQQVKLTNPTKERIAVKVKCSNNNMYRVDPVYSFVNPGCSVPVRIMRYISSSKADKLVFLTTPANDDDEDPKLLFESMRLRTTLPLSHLDEYDSDGILLL
ncbi:Sperm-specific class P protein 19 [Toxocara canis]|uniref:Major sperm protein n=1 Tax=Toxocara canis TaxID=6265 RepID=A0A0B2V613_TOXCA|nr:Sperm-specific class P protein 19 [Toxocara canis]